MARGAAFCEFNNKWEVLLNGFEGIGFPCDFNGQGQGQGHELSHDLLCGFSFAIDDAFHILLNFADLHGAGLLNRFTLFGYVLAHCVDKRR